MFQFFSSARRVFVAAVLLRVVLLTYGYIQDTYTPLKYTDIDYFVFTDAARFVYNNASPYSRETYRYTPLLAYLLLPTVWTPSLFAFGKVLFAASDLLAGWLILLILTQHDHMPRPVALRYASIWLLNPMVAAISTRGSSEGLLGVMVLAVLWATLSRYYILSGALLGIAVHFKIYPFIYGVAILWWMDVSNTSSDASIKARPAPKISSPLGQALAFLSIPRATFLLSSLTTFSLLNLWMYQLYGQAFLQETYLHHLTRLDHRHNFSIYNTLLHLSSLPSSSSPPSTIPPFLRLERLSFLPQLLLGLVILPLTLAKRHLPATLLAQTFAFVTFNKVCTSQYFLWYLVLLPLYLSDSSLIGRGWRKGVFALTVWVAGQAWWLYEGWRLEFLGESTFVPGLWSASIVFFVVNVWILGVIVDDVRRIPIVAEVKNVAEDQRKHRPRASGKAS